MFQLCFCFVFVICFGCLMLGADVGCLDFVA
jgi:hypothetical protein